jgi:hypothetical protein
MAPDQDQNESNAKPAPPASRRGSRFLYIAAGILLVYLLGAYVVAPFLWHTAVKRHPNLAGGPRITHTANGIPGDPVNLALVGAEAELVRAMSAAKWYPADPITLRTSLRIAVDSVFSRPDDEAPVSDLFLFGRKQDLAFEQPIGESPRQRHHVRFWRWDREEDGRAVWFGAGTMDERVGLSHTTGQITHHIGPDVDAERDRILKGLQQAGWALELCYVDKFHQELQGKNGGGDPWHTDGRLGVVLLTLLSAVEGGARAGLRGEVVAVKPPA